MCKDLIVKVRVDPREREQLRLIAAANNCTNAEAIRRLIRQAQPTI